jgi:glycosyltransferase involved in cell wall biosynthesis
MDRIGVMRVITQLPVGGVERTLSCLLPRLNADSFRVTVCCTHKRGVLADVLEEQGIPVYLIKLKSRWDPRGIYRLMRLMRQERIRIVHTHMYASNISGVVAARLAGVPVVVSQVHNVNHWNSRRQVSMDSLLNGWRDKIIAVSEAVRQDYIETTGIDPQRCVVIHNGLNLEDFNRPSQAAQVRQKWGIDSDDKVVGVIARLVSQKDHETFLRAARLVKDKMAGVKFLIVGEEEESGRLARLEALAVELGLKQEVIFTGLQRDIPAVLSIMDVSVLSSVKEGFSNVVLESMAGGVPVVATDVGGNSEAIVEGVTGLLVPPKDPAALAQAITKLLEDPDSRKAMGRAGRARVEKLFSMRRVVEQTVNLYRDLLRQRGVYED